MCGRNDEMSRKMEKDNGLKSDDASGKAFLEIKQKNASINHNLEKDCDINKKMSIHHDV